MIYIRSTPIGEDNVLKMGLLIHTPCTFIRSQVFGGADPFDLLSDNLQWFFAITDSS